MKTNQRKKKKQSVQPRAREKIFNGWKNLFVLWFQSQLRHNLIATGLLQKSFISDRGLKIRNNVKSDISDETSSTLAEFAFGRSSNRIPKAKSEERF